MQLTELLDLAKDIREYLNEERGRRKISFREEDHIYNIYDPNKGDMVNDLPSVSTVLKNWYEPFDSVNKSLQMMNGDVKLAEDLRKKWEKKGDDANSIGSFAHYKLEQYIWSIFDIDKEVRRPYYDLKSTELLTAQEMTRNGINMINMILDNGFVPIDTEVVMGSTELGYVGQCDNMWLGQHKGKIVFLMTDHKTNQEKNFEAAAYNMPMKEPFEELLDTALYKYYIQQPLYAQLFKDMLKDSPYKDIEFIGFRILHLRTEKSHKIPLWVYREVKKLYPIKEHEQV